MEQSQVPVTNSKDVITVQQLKLQVATVFLVTTSVILLAFSLAYIQDLETLRTVPDAIWDAICGRPTENGLTLPLLLTGSTLAFITAIGLSIWQWIAYRE